MHRKFWFLAAAAVALFALAGSAAAVTSGRSGVPAAGKWAGIPMSNAARAAKSSIVVAEEQDLAPGCGWNVLNGACNLAWATWIGWNPILRGPYLVAYSNNHYVYKYDLATSVKANAKGITYTINPKARWNYGGVVSKVTWQDFVYTVKTINNVNNQVASNVGINQISSFKHTGNTVTFFWKKPGQTALGGDNTTKGCTGNNACGPFADYKDLIGSILPFAATHTLDFNSSLFANCVCGANGKYITDGPYYMQAYNRGSQVVLKKNPKGWYGTSPKVATVYFKDVTSTTTEIQGIKGGEYDIGSPQPTPDLAPLAHVSTINYKVLPGNYLEHIDMQENANQGPNTPAQPLLANDAWFRQAVMMGLNRAGIISAALPGVAPGLKPLNSLLVFQSDKRYKAPFAKWDYAPQKAIDKLKANGCTGGPDTPTPGTSKVFTCNGHKAEFAFTYAQDNSRRLASFSIIQQELQAIGMKVDADGLNSAHGGPFFGHVDAGNYNATEFAWGGSIDPGGFEAIWGCGGGSNYLNYCNHTATNLMHAADSQLHTAARDQDYIQADAAMSADVPAIPLYALPEIVTYKKTIAGVKGNPAAGFTWNIEAWHWK